MRVFALWNSGALYCLSGSVLKCIAFVAMLADHSALAFIPEDTSMYRLLRTVGRIAFPVFAYMAAQGLLHTRNRWRYITVLWIFAVLCEPLWQMLSFTDGRLNILFTLATGITGIVIFEVLNLSDCHTGCSIRLCYRWAGFISSLLFVTGAAHFLRLDYGILGISLVMLYYILRDIPEFSVLISVPILLLLQGLPGMLLSVLCLSLYNERRGFMSTLSRKYAFYLGYPLHLAVIKCLSAIY